MCKKEKKKLHKIRKQMFLRTVNTILLPQKLEWTLT